MESTKPKGMLEEKQMPEEVPLQKKPSAQQAQISLADILDSMKNTEATVIAQEESKGEDATTPTVLTKDQEEEEVKGFEG